MGACLAAAIFSNIGQMLNKGDQVTARYQAQLDKVRPIPLHSTHLLCAPVSTPSTHRTKLDSASP